MYCHLPGSRRRESSVWGGFQPLFPPAVAPQAALKFSCRGDRVTRDGPVGLRVRAAKSGARIVQLDGPVAVGGLPACGSWSMRQPPSRLGVHEAFHAGMPGPYTRREACPCGGFIFETARAATHSARVDHRRPPALVCEGWDGGIGCQGLG